MSGLIWAGIGQGLSAAGTSAGNMMTRAIERDIDAERRRQEREEDRALRRELQEDNQRFRADQDALYRRLAVGGAGGSSRSGGGGGGGGSLGPLSEEDKDLEAAQLGMTRPQYDTFIASHRSGDMSPYKREREVTTDPYANEYPDQVSRANRGKATVSELPPGFEKEYQAKQTALARIREERLYGNAYDNVTKGRATQQGVDAAQGILEAPDAATRADRAGVVGTAMAAREGKPIYTVKGDTQLQQFTGESDTTDVGDSKVRKNDRPPASGGGSGGKGGGSGDNVTLQGLKADLASVDRDITGFENRIRSLRNLKKDQSRADGAETQRLIDAAEESLAAARERKTGIATRLSTFNDGRTSGRPADGAKQDTAKPEPKASPAARPDISKISGAPSGATIGAQVPGKGWEIKDASGKLLGYAR